MRANVDVRSQHRLRRDHSKGINAHVIAYQNLDGIDNYCQRMYHHVLSAPSKPYVGEFTGIKVSAVHGSRTPPLPMEDGNRASQPSIIQFWALLNGFVIDRVAERINEVFIFLITIFPSAPPLRL